MQTVKNKEELIERFSEIVGKEHVLVEGEEYNDFKDPYWIDDSDEFQPLFVVQPGNVEEVQEVVRLANELEVHIWASSAGRNYGYGGSAPLVSESIVINMRRMNNVLEINDEDGFALVEPGVTFFDLHTKIRENEMDVMMSVPDIAWGSLVGNSSQHGYGYTITGEHADAIVGLEVVLPNGELLRTGHGAKSNSPMWQRHKRAFGPAIDDLFKQSNFGIITKMGVALTPTPEKMTTGFVWYDGDEVNPLLERVKPLIQNETIQGTPVVFNAPRESSVEEETIELFEQAEAGELRHPTRWALRISIFGPEPVVEAKEKIFRKALSDLDNIEISLSTYDGDISPEEVDDVEHLVPLGMPTMLLLDQGRAAFGEEMGHIEFAPRIPFDADEYNKVAEKIQDKVHENGLFVDVMTAMHKKSMAMFGMIYFDSTNDEQIRTAHRIVKELIDEVGEMGYTEYRGHVNIMDDVAETFDFNDHALHKFYTTIKDAIDPKGILAPGNHGIWPSKLKEQHTDRASEAE
jgi:4-cresol dehydrogenase (hydroxylating)